MTKIIKTKKVDDRRNVQYDSWDEMLHDAEA